MAGRKRARVVLVEIEEPAEENPAVGVMAALRNLAGVPVELELAIKSADDACKSMYRAASLIDEIGEAGDVLYADVLEVLPQSAHASFDAATKLACGLFTGPFPGAIREAADLVAGLYAKSPTDGPLEKSRGHLHLAVMSYAEAETAYTEGDLGRALSDLHKHGVRMAEVAHVMFTAAINTSVAAEQALLQWLRAGWLRGEVQAMERDHYLWQAIESMNGALVIITGLKRNFPRQEKAVRDAAAVGELKSATGSSEESRAGLHEAMLLLQEASDAGDHLHSIMFEVVSSGVLDVAAAAMVLDGMPAPCAGAIQSAFDLISEVCAFPPKAGHIQKAREHLNSFVAIHVEAGHHNDLQAQAVQKAKDAQNQLFQAVHPCILASSGHDTSLIDVLKRGQVLSCRPQQCVTKAVLSVDAALVLLEELSGTVQFQLRHAP